MIVTQKNIHMFCKENIYIDSFKENPNVYNNHDKELLVQKE